MDSWIGKTKQNLIMSWGPPERTESDGGTGEVLVYSSKYYNSYYRTTTYRYTMFFVYSRRSGGTVYHWLINQGTVPPEQLNIDMYLH